MRRLLKASCGFSAAAVWASVLMVIPSVVWGQGPGRAGAPAPPVKGKSGAPIDLTGYWVSIVTEGWRFRMVTPAKGDYASIPINAKALKTADTWDPARDEAAGEQCRSYGAANIMRVPERVHITWQDDNTLKVETDAGEQVRLFHFGDWKAPAGPATWQGDSTAQWVTPPAGGRGGAATMAKTGYLKVVTTHLRPGYLRKNGVPYSANARVTEYWDLDKRTDGASWITVTTMVDDPEYLQEQYMVSSDFKQESDGAKWKPAPCSARW